MEPESWMGRQESLGKLNWKREGVTIGWGGGKVDSVIVDALMATFTKKNDMKNCQVKKKTDCARILEILWRR